MTQVIYNQETIDALADATRAITGSEEAMTVSEMTDALNAVAATGGGQKLYRHLIEIVFDGGDGNGEILFEWYTTDATNYSVESNWDEEVWIDITDLAFMEGIGKRLASGCACNASSTMMYVVTDIRHNGDNLCYTAWYDPMDCGPHFMPAEDIYYIHDTVTEVK